MERDTHIEPLTDTPLRGYGQCREHYRPRDLQRALIVIDQVYPSPSNQEAIYEILMSLQRSGKLDLVLVEGAQGTVPVVEENRGRSFKDLTEDAQVVVSPGVVRFQLDTPEATVLGIDDQELMNSHWQSLRISSKWETNWDQLSEEAQACLERARIQVYTEDMLWISRCVGGRKELSLGDQVGGLVRIARSAGVEVDHFPMVARFLAAIELERSLDFSTVERERSEYIRALVDRLTGWWDKRGGRPAFRFEEVRAALEYWVSETGLESNGKDLPGNLEQILTECSEWIIRRLVDRSLRYRAREVSHSQYYSEVVNLGLRMNVDIFRFPNLLRYFRYVESSAFSPTGLMGEVEALASDTMDQLAPDQGSRKLRVLDEDFRILEKAGRRELTPREANRFYHDITWESLLERLGELVPEARSVNVGRWADEATTAAYEFCQISARREKVMLDAVLDQLSAGGVSTAALVCGGFHAEPIVRVLREDRPDIGWSHITPRIDSADLPAKSKSQRPPRAPAGLDDLDPQTRAALWAQRGFGRVRQHVQSRSK